MSTVSRHSHLELHCITHFLWMYCLQNTQTNEAFCGSCNKQCGANQQCVGGVCVCAPGYTDCDESASVLECVVSCRVLHPETQFPSRHSQYCFQYCCRNSTTTATVEAVEKFAKWARALSARRARRDSAVGRAKTRTPTFVPLAVGPPRLLFAR